MDTAEDHKKWKTDIESYAGATPDFPIIADDDLAVSKAFDMLPSEAYLPDGRTPAHSATVRSVFIIAPDKTLRLSMTYPMTIGRNFCRDSAGVGCLAAQRAAQGIATPANWQLGQDVIVPPTVSNEDATAKFGEFDAVLPYLRKVKLPQ